MAFFILGYVQTREVRGGNKLTKVREYQVISLPSETYFQFRRDATQPCYDAPKPCAAQFADRIEKVLASPVVTDVVYSQDTKPGGTLVDLMTTYYSTLDGKISGSVEQPLASFGPTATLKLVNDEIAAGGDRVGA